MPPGLFFLSRLLWLFRIFVVPYTFQDWLFYFCEKCHWNCDGDWIDFHFHGMPFYTTSPFILCVCLDLKWASWRQHTTGFIFVSIQPLYVFWLENVVCLPITFVSFIAILLIYWICFYRSFFPHSVFVLFWWLSLVLWLVSFFLCVIVYLLEIV